MTAPAEPWEAFADAVLYTEAAVARIGRGDPPASLSGLFVDDADLSRLLAELPGLRGPEPEEAAAVRVELAPVVASAREALSAAAQQPSSVFDAICWNAGLSTDEAEVFAVLCAVALHPGRQRLVGYLHDDMTRQQVTPWLLTQMFPPPHLADLVVTPDASLARAALVRSDHTVPWAGSPMVVPAMVAWSLRGSGSSDPALPRAIYLVHGPGGGEATLVMVTGGDRSSRVRAATEAAIGSAFLVSLPPAVPEGWEALIRQATVMGVSIVLEVEDRIPTEARWWVDRARHLPWAISSPVELQVESLPRRDWIEVSVEHAEATAADWMEELGTAPLPGHQLTLDELRQVAQTAPGVGGDLTTAIRRVAAGHLGGLALRIRPERSWGDLVLPPDQMSQLSELASRYRHRSLVYDDWGFRPIPSPGLVALFAGPSGTGKTLAAEVVAGELGLDLYKVDLSSVVSKYVGETEKNLAELFDQAVGGNIVLFFDEADSLFGKRTDVSDAHDRYANIEVSYLLQRLERHEGLVVLATNLQRNIDQAFLRRIHVAVEFPAPEEDERLAIWGLSLPPEAPIGALDLGFLARQFKVPGGSIRNAALHAAFLAAEESEPITMEHVIHGMKREFQKLGRLRTETDFDRYFSLVKGSSMLQLVDEGLEEFLRSSIDLSREEVDFSFDAPDDDWRAGLTKPTVDLFLWDIRRSADENAAGRELVEKDGARQWRNRLPRIDLRYLVTAWTSEIRDEHRLLGSLLQSLLATGGLDPRFLRAPLADLEPYPSVKVARTEGKDFTELWSAVEGKLKPGLDMLVTVTVDPSAGIEAGPPTERVRIATTDKREPSRRSERRATGGHTDAPAGSRVVTTRGSAKVQPDGTYLVPGDESDPVEVEPE